jgi:hypothetical protein
MPVFGQVSAVVADLDDGAVTLPAPGVHGRLTSHHLAQEVVE